MRSGKILPQYVCDQIPVCKKTPLIQINEALQQTYMFNVHRTRQYLKINQALGVVVLL